MIAEATTVAVAVLGSGAFVALINGGFGRRQSNAGAEVTSGTAWASFVAERNKEDGVLRGQIAALREEVSKLQRQNLDHAYWQARVTSREDIVQALLAAQGISVPPMPEPPAAREFRTRAGDSDA